MLTASPLPRKPYRRIVERLRAGCAVEEAAYVREEM